MITSGSNGIMHNAAALYEKTHASLNNFKAWVQLDSTNLNGGQQLAVKYFTVAVILFFAQILFGMLAAIQFIVPGFL